MQKTNMCVRVAVQLRDFWCEGDITVPTPDSYKGRLVDLLNGAAEFIALTDVELYREGHGASNDPIPYDVLLLRKGAIQFVLPN